MTRRSENRDDRSEGAYRAGWHRSLESGLFSLALSAGFLGAAFFALSGLALGWNALFGEMTQDIRAILASIPISLIAATLLCLVFGLIALARGSRRPVDIAAPLVLSIGACGLVTGGGLELLAMARGGPRPAHALSGVISIASILAGVILSRREFALVAARLALEETLTKRVGRRLRLLAYLALAVGVALPFVPMSFAGLTPRECAIRTAALGTAVFSIPLLATCYEIVRLLHAADRSQPRLDRCPRCGYPRAPMTRCPECGHDVNVLSV